MWITINQSLNQLPTFQVYFNKGPFYRKALISLNEDRQSIQKVKFSQKKKIYYTSKEINLTLCKFELLPLNSQPIQIKQEENKIIIEKELLYGIELKSINSQVTILTLSVQQYEILEQFLNGCCIRSKVKHNYMIENLVEEGAGGILSVAIEKKTQQKVFFQGYNKQSLKFNGDDAFYHQITIYRRLKYPGILRLKEVYESSNTFYLVNEYVLFKPLLDRLTDDGYEQIKLTRSTIQKIMKQILEIIRYMHHLGIMHRDIKPNHIGVREETGDLSIILTDVGLTDYIENPKMFYKRCGTPGYMAPEILNYKEGMQFYNEKVDIYSIGVIFYLLLSGSLPFEAYTADDIIQLNRQGKINYDIIGFNDKVKLEVSLIQRMLEFDPKNRISADDALSHNYFNEKFENSDIEFHQNIFKFRLIQGLKLTQSRKSRQKNNDLVSKSQNHLDIVNPMTHNYHRHSSQPKIKPRISILDMHVRAKSTNLGFYLKNGLNFGLEKQQFIDIKKDSIEDLNDFLEDKQLGQIKTLDFQSLVKINVDFDARESNTRKKRTTTV